MIILVKYPYLILKPDGDRDEKLIDEIFNSSGLEIGKKIKGCLYLKIGHPIWSIE